MINIKHFEHLWEQCEEHHASHKTDSSAEIIEELLAKVALYQVISSKEMPEEDMKKIKSHALGEILFTLTNLSLKDNVNVFEALFLSLNERK